MNISKLLPQLSRPLRNKAFFATTANKRLHLHQLDVGTAFLKSNLDNWGPYWATWDVSQRKPRPGLAPPQKSLWPQAIRSTFVRSFHRGDARFGILSITIWHCFISRRDRHIRCHKCWPSNHRPKPQIQELKTRLAQHFEMTNLGPTLHYLGMKVHGSEGAVTITPNTYV